MWQPLFEFALVLLATAALRDVYFNGTLFADFIASREDGLAEQRGARWFFNTLVTCKPCATYWMGLGSAVAIWVFPAIGGWAWKIPTWLLAGLVAGFLVNRGRSIIESPGENDDHLKETILEVFEERDAKAAAVHREMASNAVAIHLATPPAEITDAG